ncbi:hypothetical protein [Alteromonas sp. 14N.309.X.WAT.G.H12]|uniref:hypothetical protein n=1 Tax=Alteromonas sp. 14N.309.X.WAT.G.H12 TaxID=3120824 RepID=UPI002FD12E58
MDESAYKIQRAQTHLEELQKHFLENPPFTYQFFFESEGDYQALGYTMVVEHEDNAKLACTISADIVHNLRVALEQSFWRVANKYAMNDYEKRKVMFPFFKTEKEMNEKLNKGFFERIDKNLRDLIIKLRPFREGGDSYLCNVHDLDVADKHRALLPYASISNIDLDIIKKSVYMFPKEINGEFNILDLGSSLSKHFVWSIDLRQFALLMKPIVYPDKVVFPEKFSTKIPLKLNFVFKGSDFLEQHTIEELIAGMTNSVKFACEQMALLK